MVKIRLTRTGTRNAPCYRIVAADARSPRDGKFLEIIGLYDPIHNAERIDLERYDYWVSVGAQVSGTVKDIVRRVKKNEPTTNNKAKIRAEKKAELANKAKEEAVKASSSEEPAIASEEKTVE